MKTYKATHWLLAILFVISLVISSLCVFDTSVNATSLGFAGGNGTEVDPYLIETKEQLNNVRNDLDAHYKMVADIIFTNEDFSEGGLFYNNKTGWEPIGTFRGVFDGNGHSIHNLFFDIDTKNNCAGLFSDNQGTIKNLSVENVDFTADATYDNYAKNVSVDVGVIAGRSSGHITNCFTSGTIRAYATLGGTNASTNYTADVCGGGVVGTLLANGTISNCYNTTSITLKSTASQPTPRGGGISGKSFGRIMCSYNVGTISASCAGGIVGSLDTSGEIVGCYYFEKCTRGVGSGKDNCVKCSLEEMENAETFTEFNFADIWTLENQGCYPYPILINGVTPTLSSNTTEFAGGSGAPWNPYLIAKKEHLNNVRNHPDACFKLICDIEFDDDDFKSGGLFYNSGKGWLPIGENWKSPFGGTLDGCGYRVVNLQIHDAKYNDYDTGLIGYNSGTIKNITIADSQISSISYPSNIGCLVGNNSYKGIIENCSTIETKLTSSAGQSIGGIVGYNEGIVKNCSNHADIISNVTAPVGGICGFNVGTYRIDSYLGIIQYCSNSGNITFGAPSESVMAGGIVGRTSNNSTVEYSYNLGDISIIASTARVGGISGLHNGNIQRCYNAGDIAVTTTGNLYVGGVSGKTESGLVLNSYNTASVSGASKKYPGEAFVGGIVGMHESVLTTSNCYTLGSVVGEGSSAGTYVGYVCGYNATSTIENCYYLGIANNGSGFGDATSLYGYNVETLKNQSTYSSLDFEGVWTMSGNSDYPFPELVAVPMVYEKEIKSIAIESLPTKLSYIQNYESINLAGGSLKVTYAYNEHEIIPLSEAVISGFDNSVLGKQELQVSYLGCTTTFEVEIIQESLVSIEVTEKPSKLSYMEDEPFDITGMVVTAYYNNNTSKVVTDFTISGYSSTPGTKTITVSYGGFSTSFVIDVIAIDYTVTFYDWDGSVISSAIYHKGDMVTPPAVPIRQSDSTYTYAFSGWNTPVVNCTGNDSYTATYIATYIDYVVTFKNWDGTVISSQIYHYGDAVVEPPKPARPDDRYIRYTFAGWDKTVESCVGEATYTAIYSESHIHYYTPAVTPPTCTLQGYTVHNCICGDNYVDSYVAEKGHSYSAATFEPTYTVKGYTQYTCHCGESYCADYVAALGLPTPKISVTNDAQNGRVELSWNTVSECSGYEIYRTTSKSGKYSLVGTVETTTWQDTSASVGKTYYYKVKAVYAEDISLNSSFSSIVSAATKCATPELSVKAGSTGKPVLTWSKITGAKKYEIWRSVDGGAFKKLTTSTKLTYTDSKATAGAECSYKVKALGSKSSYNGEFSSTGSCYVTCAAPSLTLKLDSKTGKPALSWKKITGAKSYAIYRSANGGEYELLTTTTSVSYKDQTVQADNKYSYYVITVGKAEVFNSVASATKSITLAVKAPKLSGSADANGKPVISWAAVENAVSYKIYRSTKSSKSYVLVETTTDRSYTDTTVATGKTFYYKVVAVGANTESTMSSYLKMVGKCATPTIQVAVDETSGKPVISWEKIEGAKKYTVYRATSENGKYSKLGTSTKLTYTDTKATVGTKYFYKIVANPSSNSANSNYSNIESCLTICAKAVVTVKVDATTGKPTLSWGKVTGAKTYEIYRSENGGAYVLATTQTAVSYKDATAVAGNTYSYQVKVVASKTGADSFLSAEKAATATLAQPKLTGKAGATGKPALTWNAVDGATKYVIYRSTSSSKGYTVLNETEDLSFTDTTAVKSKTYYYKIVAVCGDIQSTQSAYVKVKSK